MKEENKKSKKKVLLYYLILAACLLVIAAVTVTVIFTVNRPVNDTIIDSNQGNDDNKDNDKNQGNNDDNKDKDKNPGNNGGDDNKDNKPTGSDTTYGMPTANSNITTKYEFAYDTTLDRYCVHTGMDFEGSVGDNVSAVLDGTVTELVKDSIIGENYVTVKHANGVTSTYKYIEATEGLKVGDSVRRGDVIGKIAAAAGMEMKQGEHLHFEMQVNGKPADPNAYLNIIEK